MKLSTIGIIIEVLFIFIYSISSYLRNPQLLKFESKEIRNKDIKICVIVFFAASVLKLIYNMISYKDFEEYSRFWNIYLDILGIIAFTLLVFVWIRNQQRQK